MNYAELPAELRGRCDEAQVPWRSDDEVFNRINEPGAEPPDDGIDGIFRSPRGWVIRSGVWQTRVANRPWAEAFLALGPPTQPPERLGAGFGSHWWPRSEGYPRIDYLDPTYQRIVRALIAADGSAAII